MHELIRGLTENSLLHLNKNIQMRAREVKTELFKIKSEETSELEEQLQDLDLHLILWLTRYEYWIAENPQHAVFYMADEKMHGIGFPNGIEQLISEILAELQ